MASTEVATDQTPSSDHLVQLRRAVIASTIGTAIEWYDFFLYSTVTGLVFAKLYFPHSDPWVGTLEAFAIYAVGFVARPVGAAIFGHYGDRIGRKSTLIATLLLMGLATFAVALVPTYESIGIWGAVLLTLLRFIQGVGVGGEWGGSVLMSMEWARSDRSRGFVASWPQFGVPCGLFLANLAVLACSHMSNEQFIAWGWRVPFLLSVILVGLGLYIRLGILETPIFTRLVAQREIARAPILQVIRQHPKEIILSAIARLAEQTPFYIFTAFIFSYGIGTLHVSRDKKPLNGQIVELAIQGLLVDIAVGGIPKAGGSGRARDEFQRIGHIQPQQKQEDRKGEHEDTGQRAERDPKGLVGLGIGAGHGNLHELHADDIVHLPAEAILAILSHHRCGSDIGGAVALQAIGACHPDRTGDVEVALGSCAGVAG